MSEFLGDLRYAWRMLTRNPGFAAVAVFTLALAIGANTALFSVVNAVLLRSLPYRDAGRLAVVWHNDTKEGDQRSPASHATLQDLRQQTRTFQALAGVSPEWDLTVMIDGVPERLSGYFVSASLFPMLGVEPIRGRWLLPEEDQSGAPPAAVLSSRLAERLFGQESSLDGRALMVDGVSTTVVGIMPPGFRFLEDVDLWLPSSADPLLERFASRIRSVRWITMLGQLAPGTTHEQAQAEMATLMRQLEQEYPNSNSGLGANVVPLLDEIVGDIRPALLVLWGTVGFVLLIACVNVANLLLARSAAREVEIAVRDALGASRMRLVRQLVTESLLLAVLGGGASLPLAFWIVALLGTFAPVDLPRLDEVGIDAGVLTFTLVVSVATGVLFGAAPMWRLSRLDLHDPLKQGARTSGGLVKSWTRQVLVVAEVALTLVLLVGAGLLIRSFISVVRVDPGFNPDHVLTLQISLPSGEYSEAAQRAAFYDQLFESLDALPDVQTAGASTRLPLGSGVTTSLEIEERPLAAADRPQLQTRRATPGYFPAMGIPLRRGRTFTRTDTVSAPLVALINEAADRRFWPGQDPIGTRVQFSGADADTWWTIVGVVGDVRHFGLDAAPRAEVYTPFAQGPPSSPFVAIRALSDPMGIVPAVRTVIRNLDSEVTIQDVTTLERSIGNSLAPRRFNLWLIGLFAALSLILAAVGLYGVMSYAVSQRTREIGIRMALGARSGDAFKLIVGQGMALTAIGLTVGLAASFALTRVMVSLLFGVSATDSLTFAAMAGLLAVVALAACYIPARRATRVDPVVALRYE